MLTMSTRNIFQKWFILILYITLVAYVRYSPLFCHLGVIALDLEVFMYFDIVATLLSHFALVYADFLIYEVSYELQVRVGGHLHSSHKFICHQSICDVHVADRTLCMRLKPFL